VAGGNGAYNWKESKSYINKGLARQAAQLFLTTRCLLFSGLKKVQDAEINDRTPEVAETKIRKPCVDERYGPALFVSACNSHSC
jgi:hypothetical protein